MKDYANRKKFQTRNVTRKKTIFRSKKNTVPIIPANTILGMVGLSFGLAIISFLYFKTDIQSIEPRENTNVITID
ncbi:MAG: hypothetical protein EBX21_00760, partial [Proteobacteria bacterium]|nr:hypothetical protein [Pseudomonadota bacterium]